MTADLERFEDLFLGTSPPAAACVLLNPEVLHFARDPAADLLVATASAPLRIENRSLGYRIDYDLDALRGNVLTSFYSGTARFTELAPRDAAEAERWRKNRLRAYRGSLRRFLTALAQGSLARERFDVLLVDLPGQLPPPEITRNTPFSRFGRAEGDGLRLAFDGALVVVYRGGRVERGYVQYQEDHQLAGKCRSYRDRAQYSWLTLRAEAVAFNRGGLLHPSSDLVRHGYWGWAERLAVLLPLDYTPAAP